MYVTVHINGKVLYLEKDQAIQLKAELKDGLKKMIRQEKKKVAQTPPVVSDGFITPAAIKDFLGLTYGHGTRLHVTHTGHVVVAILRNAITNTSPKFNVVCTRCGRQLGDAPFPCQGTRRRQSHLSMPLRPNMLIEVEALKTGALEYLNTERKSHYFKIGDKTIADFRLLLEALP